MFIEWKTRDLSLVDWFIYEFLTGKVNLSLNRMTSTKYGARSLKRLL